MKTLLTFLALSWTCYCVHSQELGDHEKKRAEILKNMQKVMGEMPDNSHKVPLDVKVISEEKLDGYIRKKITYAVEKNDRVPAWLLIPLGKEGKRPAMLCLHQTINIGKDEPVGLGKQESKQQALHLVKRGYVSHLIIQVLVSTSMIFPNRLGLRVR